MSLQACADIVARGDPDRFAAAMAAPVAAREVLFPLYAFNVEVARAPWASEEPMIGEMRLQWWRDVLEEIGQGQPPRQHEVVVPLAALLDPQAAAELDHLVAMRRWDLYKAPFEDEAHFVDYLGAGAALMWTATRLLGAPDSAKADVTSLGRANALARFFQAVPALEHRGRVPLMDARAEAVGDLAKTALAAMPKPADLWRKLDKPARAASLEAWQAGALLKQVVAQPARVAEGALDEAEVLRRGRLLVWSLRI